jgi:tRNA A37 threonylcarbamoyladenosine dehydratase
MIFLIQCIVRFVEQENVENYADAVVYLMDCYDNVIFDYARGGVALLATLMLISRN